MNRQDRPRVVSMKLVLSLTTVALMAVTMFAVYGITARSTRQALQTELEARLLLEARHLALLSSDALLADYPELTLCPLVTEMMTNRPGLALAVVVDHNGLVQGHADVRQLGKPLDGMDQFGPYQTQQLLNTSEVMLVSTDLLAARVPSRHAAGQVVGSVLVAKNRDHIDAALSAARGQVTLAVAALTFLGACVALILMQRLLAPVDAIRKGLQRIGDGRLDEPIAVKSNTELGLLADTINTMAQHLQSSQNMAQEREQEVIATQSEVIHTLGEVVENRSQETGGHIDRVADGAALLAQLAGLPVDQCELLRRAAPMHDVGKIAIPDAILHKPGKLTDVEFDTMKSHAAIGAEILSQSERPIFKAAAVVAAQHHERWDGFGYPSGLAGEAIHPFGRIVSVVDVFDALTSHRCYRPAMPLEKALDIMHEGRGSQFDPELLDTFLAHIGEFVSLTETINVTHVDPKQAPAPVAEVHEKEPEPVGVGC